jgi:hypothetical protein
MERRVKRARQWRDGKRDSVREGGWLRKEVALVVKTTVEENGPFGIRIGLEQKDYINYQNYQTILMIRIYFWIIKCFWRHLVQQQIVVSFLHFNKEKFLYLLR